MTYSFDWRCDACERPNQHDFPDDIAVSTRTETGDNGTIAAEPSRVTAGADAPAGGGGRRESEENAGADALAGGGGRRESEKNAGAATRIEAPLECSSCHRTQPMATAGFTAAGALRDPLEACLVCGSARMYSRKDFNSRLGIAIVLVGAAFSPWTYGLSLVACMAFDYGLYYFVPEITVCYACDAIHRGFEHNPAHRAHDPLLAERYRREARQELGLDDAGEGAKPERAEG